MGQSGHNLKISKFRCGCRLPHELSSAGDGYAASGPVRTYKLSPKELARYGPVKPRKESVWKVRLEEAKKALPREKLLDLLAQGKKQTEIIKEHGLSTGTYYQLKKHYGIKSAGRKPTTLINDKCQPVNEKAENLNDKQDAWTWAVPVRLISRRKVLTVKDDRVGLSTAAVKILLPAKFVKIGVSKEGVLALSPAEDEMEGYKLHSNGEKVKYSQLGGGALVRFLKEHGFGPGEYELEQNKKGWLVTTAKGDPEEEN